MPSEINPTTAFINAATKAAMNVARQEPEIAQTADSILTGLANFSPSARILDAHGDEVILTQQHVNLTVMYSPHSEIVKKGVLGIFTRLPEFERLPEAWHHRI